MSLPGNRYWRQKLLGVLGPEGQQRLEQASVLVIGCGALGSMQAQLLARAGVGRLRILDPDTLELSNLHRQLLYDENDLDEGAPKIHAAIRRLQKINSAVTLEGLVAAADASNLGEHLEGMDLVLDGSDNMETRYAINEACVRRGLPWVYGGVHETTGMVLAVVPGEGPCFCCVNGPQPNPTPGEEPTSLSSKRQKEGMSGGAPGAPSGRQPKPGILNTVPATVASHQVSLAYRILLGQGREVSGHLFVMDLWEGLFQTMEVTRDEACPCCGSKCCGSKRGSPDSPPSPPASSPREETTK